MSILDYETDQKISESLLDWYNQKFDATIIVPNRKSYFHIQGIDSNGLLFQRFLKQLPLEPIFYSINFERVLKNNSFNRFDVIVKSFNKYLSTIGLELSTEKSSLFFQNISSEKLNIDYGEEANFSVEFFLDSELEPFEINILPIIIVNDTQKIYFKKQKIILYSIKNESFAENITEFEVNNLNEFSTTYENSNLSEKSTIQLTQLEYRTSTNSNQVTTGNLEITNLINFTTKKKQESLKKTNLISKILVSIYWFFNYILSFF